MAAAEWDVIREYPADPAGFSKAHKAATQWDVVSEEVDAPVAEISARLKAASTAQDQRLMSHRPGPIDPVPTGREALGALQGETLVQSGGIVEGITKAIQGSIFEPVTRLFTGQGLDKAQEFGTDLRRAGQEHLELTKPKDPNRIQENILGAIRSTPAMAVAVASSFATRSPNVGAFIAGLGTYGHDFAEVADNPNLTPEQKQGYALATGIVEGLGEVIPLTALLRAVPEFQSLARIFGYEIATEEVTAIVQQKVAEYGGLSRELSKQEWKRLVGDTAIQTLLLVGTAELPLALGTTQTRPDERPKFEPPGLPPQDFIAPDDFEIGRNPLLPAETSGFDVVGEEPDPFAQTGPGKSIDDLLDSAFPGKPQETGQQQIQMPVFTGKTSTGGGQYGASIGSLVDGTSRVLLVNPDGGYFWGDRKEAMPAGGNVDTGGHIIVGADKDATPALFATSAEARAAGEATPQVAAAPPTAPVQEFSDAQIEANVRQAIVDSGDAGASELDILKRFGVTEDAMIDRYSDAIGRLIPEDEQGNITGDFEVVDNALPKIKFRLRKAATTPKAKPFIKTMYRGAGRPDGGSIYANPDSPPILGPGRYFAFTSGEAYQFGPDVERVKIELENPLVIRSDKEWGALTKEAGWEYANPSGLDPKVQREMTQRLQDLVKQRGHDGIVIDFDNNFLGDTTPDGRGFKLLRKVFEIPQVISFGEAKESDTATTTDLENLVHRIADEPDLKESLKRFGREAGWAEKGGRGIQQSDGTYAEGGTNWVPRADWWVEVTSDKRGHRVIRRSSSIPLGTEGQYRKAVSAALKGKRLGANQEKIIRFLVDMHDNGGVEFQRPPGQKDLLGNDAETQAGLSKKGARIRRKLGEGSPDVPPEVGGRGDLFGEDAARAEEAERGRQSDFDIVSEEPDVEKQSTQEVEKSEPPSQDETDQLDDLGVARIKRARKSGVNTRLLPGEKEDIAGVRADVRGATDALAQLRRDDLVLMINEEKSKTGKSIAAVRKHPAVKEVWREDTSLDSPSGKDWWVDLNAGWIDSESGTTILHEATLAEIVERLDKYVVRQDVEKAAGTAYVPLIQAAGAPAQSAQTIVLGRRGVKSRTIEIPLTPISREVAMRMVERLFGVKIYQGKPFRVRDALGFFRPKTGEVRIKSHNDLEVTAHEFFHWLDRTFPTIRRLYHERRFSQELKGISYDVKKLNEGFAEFGRLFLTQEIELVMKAPNFYDAFVQEAAKVGILDQLMQVQEIMHSWYQQGAEQRALSKIGKPEYPIGARLSELVYRATDRSIASIADYLQAAKLIERTIAGDLQHATDSPYKQLRLLHGSMMIANQVVNENTLMWATTNFVENGVRYRVGDLVPSGIGLRQVLEPVGDVLQEALGYFVGRRAQELMKYGKEAHLSRDEILALLDLPDKVNRREDIERAFDAYQAYEKRILDFAQQSGILNDGTRAYWEQIYQNYVPFFRIIQEIGSPDTGRKPGGLFKRLRGGTRNINDVLENMVINTEGIVRASLRNVAKRRLYDLIESKILGQQFAVRVGEGTKPIMIGMEQIVRVLEQVRTKLEAKGDVESNPAFREVATALDILSGLKDENNQSILSQIQAQATFYLGHQQPGIIDKDFYLENGKPVWFQIGDPLLWEMVVELNTVKPLTLVERALSLNKNVLTRGTTLAPTYQIRNIIKDTFNALTLGKNIKFPIADALVALYDTAVNSPEFKAYLNNGGGFGFAILSDTKKIKLDLERFYHDNALNTRAIIGLPSKLLGMYDTVSQATELANRLAEFKRNLAAGEGARESAFRGREVSTDFGMRGNSSVYRYLQIAVPFGSAKVQGLYRIERELFEYKGKQTIKALRRETAIKYAFKTMLFVTLPTLVLYLLNKDDDWYKEENDATRDLNWLFNSGGRTVKAPKPFETGMMFGTMAERLWQYYETQNSKELMDAMKFMVVSTFSMEGLPQMVRPFYDLAMNKDFKGSPIISESLMDARAEDQFNAYTSALAIAAGKKFGVSPIKLEFLIRNYFGYLGGYSLFVADALLDPVTGGETPEKDLASYPVLDALLKAEPTRSTEYEQAFYEMAGKIREVIATARVIRQRNDVDGIAAYLGESEQEQLFAMNTASEQVKAQVNAINSQMVLIRFDKEMSGKEKRDQINALQLEKNLFFRRIVEGLGQSDIEQLRDYLEWKPKK